MQGFLCSQDKVGRGHIAQVRDVRVTRRSDRRRERFDLRTEAPIDLRRGAFRRVDAGEQRGAYEHALPFSATARAQITGNASGPP